MTVIGYMLTTKDNPFSPVTQFDAWYNWDLRHGHDCCGLLARIAMTSDGLTEAENQEEINRAIDQIIKYDYNDEYRRVPIPPKFTERQKKKYYSMYSE